MGGQCLLGLFLRVFCIFVWNSVYFITAADGKNYNTRHYNMQMTIAVGFKVNNERAVRFRKWAGQIVKDYTIQGWTMDVERLKKGHMFTDEYFERQLQHIREIRLSERKFYQKVTLGATIAEQSEGILPVAPLRCAPGFRTHFPKHKQ